MKAFTELDAVASPVMRQNIDTDIVIPIHRLRDVAQAELGPYAFEPLRYLPDGSDNPEFPLNKPAYKGAEILVADNNFACGSSREGAVWALMGMGIRAVIAPSFGPITWFQQGLRDSLAVDLKSVPLRTAEISDHEPFFWRRIDHRVI